MTSTHISRGNPALSHEGFFPSQSGQPWLDELRKRHLAALADWRGANTAKGELKAKYKAEDEAAVQSYDDGGKRHPKVTAKSKREQELAAAEAKAEGVGRALDRFLAEAVQQVRVHADKWSADLDETAAAADLARAEAAKLLADADKACREVERTRQFISKTIEPSGVRLVPFANLSVADPTPEPDLATQLGLAPEEREGFEDSESLAKTLTG
jgi:hypothetical protein